MQRPAAGPGDWRLETDSSGTVVTIAGRGGIAVPGPRKSLPARSAGMANAYNRRMAVAAMGNMGAQMQANAAQMPVYRQPTRCTSYRAVDGKIQMTRY